MRKMGMRKPTLKVTVECILKTSGKKFSQKPTIPSKIDAKRYLRFPNALHGRKMESVKSSS